MAKPIMTLEDRQAPRFHERCQAITPRRPNGACIPCHNEQQRQKRATGSITIKWHEKCQKITEHNAEGSCVPCLKEHNRLKKQEARDDPLTRLPRFCEKCQLPTPRMYDGTCIPCRNQRYLDGTRLWCDKCQSDTLRAPVSGNCLICTAEYKKNYQPDTTEHLCPACGKVTKRYATGACIPCTKERNAQYHQDHSEQRQIAAFQWQQDNPERTAEIKREASRRREARKRGNGVEPYRDLEIFLRDDWTCHLCSEPIDPSLPRNHRLGATIDHLIPISLGGPDSPTNVASAHFICNVKRGNKLLEVYVAPPLEQLIVAA